MLEDSGDFKHFDGSYNTSNGFDGVFVNESTGEVIINESKQWTGGSVSLSGQGAPNPTTGVPWPAQMTDDWVDAVVVKLEAEGKFDVANKIVDAKQSGNLTKIVTAVDRTPVGNADGLLGGISVINVN